MAHHAFAVTHRDRGEVASYRANAEQALRLYDQEKGRAPVVWDTRAIMQSHLAVMWQQGYPDQALAIAMRAPESAIEFSQPCSASCGCCFAALVQRYRREADAAMELADRAIAIATEYGVAQLGQIAEGNRGRRDREKVCHPLQWQDGTRRDRWFVHQRWVTPRPHFRSPLPL